MLHTLDPYAFIFNSDDVLAHRPCSGSAAMEEVRRGSIKRHKCRVLKPEVNTGII